MTQPRCSLVVLILAATAATQDTLDLEQVRRDFDAALERPSEQRVDKTKVAAFVDRYKGRDLGAMAYTLAFGAYFAGNHEEAATDLDRFFADGHAIDGDDHRSIAGRIYLGALARELRDEKPDIERLLQRAERTGEFYPDSMLVARVVGGALGNARFEGLARLRATIARRFAARITDASELDAALAALYGPPPSRAARAAPAPKQDAAKLTPFKETAMSGKVIDLAAYRGKVVLVDFWATWCEPCLREMPNVVRVYGEFHDRGLEIIGVSLDRPEAEAKIETTTEQFGMTWEQIYDGGYWQAKLAVANGVRSIPSTFLIDRKGEVRYSQLRGEDLRRAIAELIAETR